MTAIVKVTGVHAEVAERLRKIYLDNDDLNKQDVLDDARDESSPLHSYFEWDDSEAAEQYRLVQASQLIRAVKVRVLQSEESQPITVRAYVARSELSAEAYSGDPGSYLAIEDVAGQTAYEVSLRDSMQRDVLRLKRKYDDTSLLLEIASDLWTD